MPFSADDIRVNLEYFVHKPHAEKQRSDVLKAVEAGSSDFVLLDTRGRRAFANGHIPGAWCTSHGNELERLITVLPKDKEIVTHCWGHD
jgi:rhodanese-related sulfurtransferase